MEARRNHGRLALATVLVASMACLQPGIDPVFLTLLSAAHPVRPADHGWIVGATQAGMAVGSLITWWAGARLPSLTFPLAGLCAFLAAVATVEVDQTDALAAIRACYGLAMGFLYTKSMSDAAAGRPNGAYGAVFLLQLVLSSLTALLLPAIADGWGARPALAALCLVPLAVTALMTVNSRRIQPIAATSLAPIDHEERHAISAGAWALAAATFLFICATMMVWSFTGAMAVAAGIDEDVIGRAVAIGSIAGALTAAAVMRERPLVTLPVTGLLSGLALLAPIAATRTDDTTLFILSVILLNIGSTAIIIRGSGMATASSQDSLFRRFVTCTHSLGMIVGPVVGSVMTSAMGEEGLLIGAVLVILAGCVALLFSTIRTHATRFRPRDMAHAAAGPSATTKTVREHKVA